LSIRIHIRDPSQLLARPARCGVTCERTRIPPRPGKACHERTPQPPAGTRHRGRRRSGRVRRRRHGRRSAGVRADLHPPASRTWLSLNSGWRFHRGDVSGAQAPAFNDAAWTALSVPHTWNAQDGADGGGDYYRGIGWYRRRITVPADLSGKMFFLQFAGANQVADVWIDGAHLGQHQGGYSRFRFGATANLTPGRESVIAVKVTNADNPDIAPLSADYTFQGGIYRNVSLYAVDRLAVRMLDYAGSGWTGEAATSAVLSMDGIETPPGRRGSSTPSTPPLKQRNQFRSEEPSASTTVPPDRAG
jgi:hypothetical protein